MVFKDVPPGATAVGNPARIIVSENDQRREAKAEKLGFSAYAIARDQDDPVSRAIHGLLDHAVETDRRLERVLCRLEAAGIDIDDLSRCRDHFDPATLGKIVD